MSEQEQQEQKPEPFVPPDVKVGQDVVFLPMATRNSRIPSIGKVIHNNGNVITLYEVTPTGGSLVRESVRHIDDPKLEMNQAQRENGAWDYTEYTKAEMARTEELTVYLKAIEDCLLGGSDRELLVYYAKKFKIPAWTKIRSDTLRKAVMKCRKGEDHGLGEKNEKPPESPVAEGAEEVLAKAE